MQTLTKQKSRTVFSCLLIGLNLNKRNSDQTFGLLATIKITVLTFLVNQNYNEVFRGVCFLGIREET